MSEQIGTGAQRSVVSAADALARLRQGNDKFVRGVPPPPFDIKARRDALAAAQHPFAVVVGCSDSRVALELLFGCGLGELFVVRVAGNTVDPVAVGTIEFGVVELGAKLVVVLGHERCGAVTAAARVVLENAELPGSIGDVALPILPAVVWASKQPGDLLENAAKENVRRTVAHLRRATLLHPAIEAGELDIVGAYYDLHDGVVHWL